MARLIPEIRIVEVGPRDGLQSIHEAIPTEIKIELIQRLRRAGLQSIELTSVVSPRRVPQLADCQQVLADPAIRELLLITTNDGGQLQPGLRLPVLTPNLKGLEVALSHGVKEVAVFVSATEGFSRANINCTVEQGIEKARSVAKKATNSGVAVRGYVSCIFMDPYDGPTKPSSVLYCVQELLKMGCYEVSLGDTTGAGTPAKVATLIRYLEKSGISLNRLAGHFHDTYGQAVANVLQAYLCGIRVFDASVGGLGGCPFAPGAKGNVSTEDIVLMFQNAGIHTGVNLPDLAAIGNWINQQVGGSSSESLRSSYAVDFNISITQSQARVIRLPDFRPITYVKASLKRVKHADKLRIYQTGSDLKIILNRPNKGNALTRSMIAGLIKSLKAYNTNPSVSRIIITGSGKYFCTGANMRKDVNEKVEVTSFDLLMQLFEAIDQTPKPVIACLNGHAYGAGVALAFACDERIMVQTATINLNHTKRSVLTDLISRYVSREGDAATCSQDFTLSAHPISGSVLQILGLVTEIVDGKKDLQAKLESYLFVKGDLGKTSASLAKMTIGFRTLSGSTPLNAKMTLDDGVGKPPLAGLKVLELAGTVIAPFAGMVLADLGCDVVRVEPPPTNNFNEKAWIDSICRHKSSIVVDFKLSASRQAFLDLLEVADILIDPYRPGAFDRMVGMRADELCRRYPKLIYARVTGFSRHDKRYARALGHENNFMAVSGALPALQHMHGGDESGRGPMSKVTVNYATDFGGGSMACVVGILAAVIHRTASGKGQIVDASVQQGTSYLAIFPLQRRKGQPENEPSLPVNDVPWSDVYRTSDGKYMMVCSIEDIFYDRMIRGLGLDAAAIPDRADRQNWPKLRDILANRFLSESQNHWRGIFDDIQACVSPVLDADDADVSINQPLIHLSRTPSLPTELSDAPSQIPVLRPGQGDQEAVRRWLGADGKCQFTIDATSRTLTRVKRVDRQSESSFVIVIVIYRLVSLESYRVFGLQQITVSISF
ncbi:hypothetical protein UA08_02054 [Talaromyces atroroseus]|uniref:hydroxymethylglutaryl-CoA lyase n=1 Tax=Talaromyces atroroseus TaxID=1441469 RepID=A0A1Q5QC41_TALAT|nr:hypothetical protein UA08_02054 [Talaromyces atroroseus]OKL63505.1 hypothetical protein UA08_02054 [Talaromyces atroroseus]